MLNDAAVAQARRIGKRGTAAGLSGTTCEHYKLLLDNAGALELFTHAANLLVAARVPANVAAALALLTALRRRRPRHSYTGGTHGDTFPSPCVAQPRPYCMFADTFDEATRPYPLALQTRAGTDSLPWAPLLGTRGL